MGSPGFWLICRHVYEHKCIHTRFFNLPFSYRLIHSFSFGMVRYVVATFLSAFFGPYAASRGISLTMQGFVFAVFPSGIAITASVAPRMIMRMGTRTAVFWGMVGTATFTLLMGFVPQIWSAAGWSDKSQAYGFMVFYFLNGFIGGLAETGTTIVLTNKFKDNLGAVTASIGTVCGIGCLAGPPLGGLLYNLPSEINDDTPEHDHWSFATPFLAVAIFTYGLSIYVYFQYCNVELEEQKGSALENYKKLMKPSRLFTLVALVLSGAVVASLDPTLSVRLYEKPYNMKAAKVGLVFMVSSIAYIVTSIPVGWSVDKASKRAENDAKAGSKMCKTIQALGFFFLFVAFALLGPMTVGSSSDSGLETEWVVWVAMVIKGIGSSGNNGGYPDLLHGISADDSDLQATIAGMWNAAYALGWAAGPLMGGLLYGHEGWSNFCTTMAVVSLVYGGILFVSGVLTSPTVIPYKPNSDDESDNATLIIAEPQKSPSRVSNYESEGDTDNITASPSLQASEYEVDGDADETFA